MIPHVQGLHDKLTEKGLVVMAVHQQTATREELEVFALKHEITYPIALSCDASGYPGRGIPRGAVVGADGNIAWEGNPGDGQCEKTIEAELKKVDLFGERGLMATQKKIVGDILGRKLGAAHAALKAIAEPSAEVTTALGRLETEAKGRLARAKAAHEAGDHYGALEQAVECGKAFKGSEFEKQAEELQAEIKKSDGFAKAKTIYPIWLQVKKLAGKKTKECIAMAKQLAAASPDSFYGKKADALVRLLDKSK